MFTTTQIDMIDGLLRDGLTPEQVAERMGITYSQLRSGLLNSGKKWVVYRRLVDTGPRDMKDIQEAAVTAA